MALKKRDVTVVIPTLNEESAIGRVIDELGEEGYGKILVVDGHSEDRTVEIAKDRKAEVIYQRYGGKTGAIRTAIEHVTTPFLLVMDGDWTYPAGGISKLMEETEDHDHVIGRREDSENIPLLHRLGNWGITLVFNILMETKLNDILSGMYLLKTERAAELEFPFHGFECEATICAQLHEETGEIPIRYRERIGRRKLSGIFGLAEILFATILLSKRYGEPSIPRLLASILLSVLGTGSAVFLTAPGNLASRVG